MTQKDDSMRDECLICKAPLEYLQQDEMMECAICRKTEPSKTRCVHGHYVCIFPAAQNRPEAALGDGPGPQRQ